MTQFSPSARGGPAKPVAERNTFVSVVQGGLATFGEAGPDPSDAAANRYLGAFDLLANASKALEFLESRRDGLETALAEMSRRTEAAVAAASDRAAEWERFAADLKTRNADLERQVEALTQRAGAADAACAAERDRADAAERRAADSQKLLRGLYGKVMSAFGQGTRAYDILSVVPATPGTNVVPMPRAG